MLRLVLGPGGEVVPDLANKAYGRGAWVHPASSCLAKAAQHGLAKAFKTKISTPPDELWATVRAAAERRALGLVSAAWRSGHAALGSTLAREAYEQGMARLLVVATDARSAAECAWVYEAVSRGIGVSFGTKDALGQVTGRDQLAVIAILDDPMARRLSFTVGVAQLPAPVPAMREVQLGTPTEDG
jgi:predicted RNA-binding protein YlxR (DUF448 family)/ribosomal protein L30E